MTRPDAKTSSPSAPELTIVTVAVAPGVGDAIGEGVAGVAEDVGVGTATVALVGGTGAVVVEPGEPAEPVAHATRDIIAPTDTSAPKPTRLIASRRSPRPGCTR